MQGISEAQIKSILGNYKKKRENIRKRIKVIQDEIINTDSILQSVSMKKVMLDATGGSGGKHKDLMDAMLKHQQLERQHSMELITEMYRLIEEEERINRVMVCFRSLQGKERIYIERLYVQKVSYKTVEMESGYSHSRFEAIRSSALKHIQKLYESRLSNVQILKHTETEIKSRKHVKRKNPPSDDKQFIQLSLDL